MKTIDEPKKAEPQEAAKPNRRACRAFASCIRRKVPLHIARVRVMEAQYKK